MATADFGTEIVCTPANAPKSVLTLALTSTATEFWWWSIVTLMPLIVAKLDELPLKFSLKNCTAMACAWASEAPESRIALAAASAAASAAALIRVLACVARPMSTARPVTVMPIAAVRAKMMAMVPSSALVKDLVGFGDANLGNMFDMAISP